MIEFIKTLAYSSLLGIVFVVISVLSFFLVCAITPVIQMLTGVGL